jgi:hypothetical protein
MKDNQHMQAIPSTVLAQAQTKVDEAAAMLAPYLLALTPDERHTLPKMGEKTISFVEKAYDFAQKNPNLVPPYLDLDAFGIDFGDAWQTGRFALAFGRCSTPFSSWKRAWTTRKWWLEARRIRQRSCSTSR